MTNKSITLFLSFCTLLITAFSFFDLNAQTFRDTTAIDIDSNRIAGTIRLSLNSEVVSYKDYYIWNDKRNLAEILGERSGYFINNFGLGHRNVINYNGYDEKNIGIFKDGIYQNDIFFGGYDIENTSINEIEKIEEVSNVMSFLYGINSNGKAVNIITKDVFKNKPFSQIRFSQDRFGALFADALFSIPVSNKLYVQAGGNNHTLDGKYFNSNASVWRGRSRIGYMPSDRFNLKLNLNYVNIKRGLNEGLFPAPEDSLREDDALVINTEANEKTFSFFYDGTASIKLFPRSEALTQIKLSSINTRREYRDDERSVQPNGRQIKNDFHYITYLAELNHRIPFTTERERNIMLEGGLRGYFNRFNYSNVFPDDTVNNGENVSSVKHEIYNIYASGSAKLNSFLLLAGYKSDMLNGEFYHNYGFEARYGLPITRKSTFFVNAGYRNNTQGINYKESFPYFYSDSRSDYYEAGVSFQTNNLFVKALQYTTGILNEDIFNNGNYSLELFTKYIDGYLHVNHSNAQYSPEWKVKSDISYHNFFFKGNLNLRAGVNIKYINKLTASSYSQYLYRFQRDVSSTNSGTDVIVEDLFNADIYIGARIGSANINFTAENIFDNFNYDTYLFPYPFRGGTLQSISRVTIVWDFLN